MADAPASLNPAQLEAVRRYDLDTVMLPVYAGALANAQYAADLAALLAEAERRRLELGTVAPTVLLDAQQTARESRLRHDRALVDAQVASIQLDHDAGVLLDRFHAVVSSGEAP